MGQEFSPLNRQRKAQKFEQINRWQNSGSVETDVSDSRSEYDDFLDTLRAQAQTGKRQEQYQKARVNELMAGAVIPYNIEFKMRYFFGLADEAIQDKNKKTWDQKAKPFNLVVLTQALECTRKTAADVVVAVTLWNEHHDLEMLLKHYNEWNWLRNEGVDIEQLRSLFPNVEHLNRVTEAAWRRVLPVIAQRTTFDGALRLIKIGRFNFSDLMRETFRNDKRQAEFREHFKSQPINQALEDLAAYEVVFGEMEKADFLQTFPNWAEANGLFLYSYERRYHLDRSKLVVTELVHPSTGETVIQQTSLDAEPTRLTASAVSGEVKPVVASSPVKETHSTSMQYWKRVSSALAVLATLAGGAEKLFEPTNQGISNSAGEADRITIDQQQAERRAQLARLQQPLTAEPNNLGFENKSEKSAGKTSLFDPPFVGMSIDHVYNTITADPNRVLSYNPALAFDPADIEIEPRDQRVHTVVVQETQQSFIIKPPEIGTINPQSIYVHGYTTKDFDIIAGDATQGALGRYEVRLHVAPDEPVYMVYRFTSGFDLEEKYAYSGEAKTLAPVPEGVLLNKVRALGLERATDETDEHLAERIEQTIHDKFYYPKAEIENKLPFGRAVQEQIGDCDVANTVGLAALQHNGIEAVLVGGLSYDGTGQAMPHGELIAFLHRPDGSQVAQVLDATPSRLTESGIQAETQPQETSNSTSEPASASPVKTVSTQEPTPAVPTQQELILQEYKTHVDEIIASEKNIVTAQEYITDRQPKTTASATAKETLKTQAENVPEVTPAEWQALHRGIYGYAEYLLQENTLSTDEVSITKAMGRLMIILRDEYVIPAYTNSEQWSRHIDREQAQNIKKVITAQRRANSNFIRDLLK